ncbi:MULTISPECIES: hypothetical protein [unclassified Microcoleus]|uniref:hypothetical protein n=1 Tax=unclassified Microcoleus TaxID=2642155 RepID=UPI002FCEEB1A
MLKLPVRNIKTLLSGGDRELRAVLNNKARLAVNHAQHRGNLQTLKQPCPTLTVKSYKQSSQQYPPSNQPSG